ncbi:MAG: hypothetical protein IV090_24005 [Candidatus Sericytochromatia bacterium]|jgi:hypothetical protein|nr:hypothetical protein [Candidatus Sericytochromatia bacterium]
MEIPPRIQILATLKSGSVYYFEEESPQFSSSEPHYYVVVNHDPQTEELLILVCATSQIEKRRERIQALGYPEETLVFVSPQDYPLFTKNTVFDCNTAFEKTVQALVDKCERGKLRVCTELMPDLIIQKLREGLKSSPKITRKIKKML